MKILSTSIALALLGSSAFATTVVHVAGSSAFRGATENAIVRTLAANGSVSAAYLGSSLAGASQATFIGTFGSDTYVVECTWTGSASGVQTVAKAVPVSVTFNGTSGDTSHVWIAQTGNVFTAAVTGASGPTGGTALTATTAAYDPASPADWAMTDVFQATTPFKTPLLTDTQVGIVPFEFVANADSPATLNNVTPQSAQSLFANQFGLPLALFTGLNADEGTLVFPIGRDADSGTRLTTVSESRVGTSTILAQEAPTNQAGNIIGLTFSGVVAAGPIVSQELFPAETINTINYAAGNTGYSSGGQLANAMRATGSFNAIGGYYVGYLGLSDTNTAIAGGVAHVMSYNGVPYSATALEEGLYTFWGYEHQVYQTSYSGTPKTFAVSVANNIIATDATVSGLKLSDMKVTRPGDGGAITNNY